MTLSGPRRQADRRRHLDSLLRASFDRLSSLIAGGERVLPPDAAADRQAADFIADDPDDMSIEGQPFVPEFSSEPAPSIPTPQPRNLSDSPDDAPFDSATLPAPTQGRFTQVSSELGTLVRFTRGVGEAPDNIANRNHPLYRARASFVSQIYESVLDTFDASPAGQWRSVNAEVSPGRSDNSDHYSGGAFDVRASTAAEARRLLQWASDQSWVSFAQVYPDNTVHISADIGYFVPRRGEEQEGGSEPSSGTETASATSEPPSAPSQQIDEEIT